MKMNGSLLAAALLLSSFAASSAKADTLLNNDFGGVISGDNFDVDAWSTTNGFGVTNSFSLSADATVNSFTIALWLESGDTLTSLNWYFTTAEFGGATLDSGSGAPTTETFLETNGDGYSIVSETFDIAPGVALSAGTTYWFQIDTGVASNVGSPVFWDQSDGPSSAFQAGTGQLPDGQACDGLCTGSESFELFGTSSVPEPGTVAMLGAGLAAIVGLRRRIQSKKSI